MCIRTKESEFFAIYEISDKGSSWIGPLVVGALHGLTGNIRYSFVYLVSHMSCALGSKTYKILSERFTLAYTGFDTHRPDSDASDLY